MNGGRSRVPSPLHYRAFRAALVSRAISGLGNWMQVVAAGWLVFDVTGTAAAVGILTVAARGPSLVLSLYGGTLADRFDRRMIVAVTRWSSRCSPACSR